MGNNNLMKKSLIFPFLIRGGKPMPLYTFVLAFVFCIYNGYLQSRYLSQYAVYADDWVTDPRFLVGFCLWLIGMLINIHSDHILRNLRKPGETGYKIPRGGFFEYVTAANYFGEVVEWCGYSLASWSLQGGAFALFTFCILCTRAQQHHQREIADVHTGTRRPREDTHEDSRVKRGCRVHGDALLRLPKAERGREGSSLRAWEAARSDLWLQNW
ncbi:3-oxo-5-alpha-steroid 4-dehydrogenase 1 isoform X1 [Mirounga leonina]|uniref:3-oxo-5-alpha-steroid 4-dehydrogenase 1 isoform X1 n=1 Tax=Mirounga leonina TaxID=9715 RepID=UPI00156C370D|nr:3-oxo-5-alpha-steroid 4-dehydrogenase 1 isoform X1 [Mirounga leonina]